MHKRSDYMAKNCTHREYYGQFVDDEIRNAVGSTIGMGRILASTDKHLNDIPLAEWDRMCHRFLRDTSNRMRDAGDFLSMAGWVCIAKEAARQLTDETGGSVL